MPQLSASEHVSPMMTFARRNLCGACAMAVIAFAVTGIARAQDSAPPPPPAEERSAEARILGGPPPPPPLSPAQQLVADLGTPGFAAVLPMQAMPANGPWPSADPRDFGGTWIHHQPLELRMTHDQYGFAIPYTMAGAQVVVRRVNANSAGTPYSNASSRCRPPGLQWQRDLHFPFQIFQGEDAIEVVFQEFHGRWHIAFDPALLPDDRPFMGRSVARWDGNTLIVETSDFKQAVWLDLRGNPLSADGRLIERIRKIDNGDHDPLLEIVTTVIDPRYYTKSWSFVRVYSWRPNMTHFNEYNCEEQIGDPFVSADGGLITEPDEQD